MRTTTKLAGAAGLVAAFGAGALLAPIGQAGAAHGTRSFLSTATLDGRSEVRTDAKDSRIAGDPNGRGEAYVFNQDADTICYVLEVEGIAAASAAHIHRGAPGTNGPVVATLTPPADGSSSGCADLTSALVGEIVATNPTGFYVNVHNADFPGGAVRGQLAPSD